MASGRVSQRAQLCLRKTVLSHLKVIPFNCIKRPSHDKLKFANSCWQTLKSWKNSCLHTSNSRQLKTHANLQHGRHSPLALAEMDIVVNVWNFEENFVHERGVKSECKKLYLPPFKFSFSAICSINFCLRFVSL